MKAPAFRLAAPEDRDALLDLWVEAWTAAMPAIDFDARRPWFLARWGDMERDGAMTIVAESSGRAIAGFATVDRAAHYVDQLAVRPAHQGQGLARALMTEMKRLCPEDLGLHVNQDNVRAVRFYEREGFVRISEGINPRSGLPVWRMRWTGARLVVRRDDSMTNAQALIEKIQNLPPERVREVEDFIDFIAAREKELSLVRNASKASAPAFAAVWSNREDDVYDAL